MMKEETGVTSRAVLAQASRLRVLGALVIASQEGLTSGALGEALDLPTTSLSFRLKELTNAGFASQERQGRHLIYRASLGQMNALLGGLLGGLLQRAPGKRLSPVQAGQPAEHLRAVQWVRVQ